MDDKKKKKDKCIYKTMRKLFDETYKFSSSLGHILLHVPLINSGSISAIISGNYY